jgi:hypothetical protein
MFCQGKSLYKAWAKKREMLDSLGDIECFKDLKIEGSKALISKSGFFAFKTV